MPNKIIIKKVKTKKTLPGLGVAEDALALRQIADRMIKRISKSFQEQSAEGMLVYPRIPDAGEQNMPNRFDPEMVNGNRDGQTLLKCSRMLYQIANTLDQQIVLSDDAVE